MRSQTRAFACTHPRPGSRRPVVAEPTLHTPVVRRRCAQTHAPSQAARPLKLCRAALATVTPTRSRSPPPLPSRAPDPPCNSLLPKLLPYRHPLFFFLNNPAPPEFSPLPPHDALPI